MTKQVSANASDYIKRNIDQSSLVSPKGRLGSADVILPAVIEGLVSGVPASGLAHFKSDLSRRHTLLGSGSTLQSYSSTTCGVRRCGVDALADREHLRCCFTPKTRH